MAEVNLLINGNNYGISCDDGQERRVAQLGQYIDARVKDIARSGAASNELHLLVLTGLMIADEVFELREEVTHLNRQLDQLEREVARIEAGIESSGAPETSADEGEIAHAIDQLADRIDAITGRLQKAA